MWITPEPKFSIWKEELLEAHFYKDAWELEIELKSDLEFEPKTEISKTINPFAHELFLWKQKTMNYFMPFLGVSLPLDFRSTHLLPELTNSLETFLDSLDKCLK